MEMNTRFNYYDILEVGSHSTLNDISEAYKKARETYSSDNPALYTIFTENEAREYLRMVEEAYSVLGNRALRSLYDEKLGKGQNNVEKLSYESLLLESKNKKPVEIPKIGLRPEYTIVDSIEEEIAQATVFNGEFLKKVREYKKVTLEKMSSVTKITAFYLDAIERMSVQDLPAPVFVRGYVIQISRYLGLDEKKVIDSYMKIFRESRASASNQ